MQINRTMGDRLKLLIAIAMVLLGIFNPVSDGWTNDSGEKPVVSKGYVPKEGFVPDKPTVMLIAHAVLIKIYGERQIASEQPFRAELRDDVWTVEGSLPEDVAGGVAIIKISKHDGRVLYVNHGK